MDENPILSTSSFCSFQYYYYDSSAFNVMCLTFDTPEHSGSLSVQAKEKKELRVVGGTGSFAFARGIAVISQTGGGQSTHENGVAASYHVKLQLQFLKLYHNKPLLTTEIIT
ncbi:uncharacterized protein LOC110265085 [Arachis ipaensis]|uniref:uncharacterized protein LOC110265085 n=1 Tax=Arachis ipaensis TaxID=130454 RepID=UPI000A2B0A46|nr:uncharacterized protein LOC110265085 [Arachis ipaensis]